MKKYRISIATLLLLSGNSFVFATEFEPIMVTATRTAQTTDETLASVTVITRHDIERQQVQSVHDVLRSVPGISITNNGGSGKDTSVFLRGTNSDHVLVLVNGVKVGSATLGTTAFQHIPIEQIERIEVVRGPRSSLYGSEAIGGVIQIFTRKGGEELKPFFSIGYGRYHAYSASAGVSGGGKRGWFNLSVSGSDTEGFNACDGKPSPGGGGCYTIEPDRDGYRELSGSLRAGYRFDNNVEMDVHLLRAVGDTESDGTTVNKSESIQQVLGGSFRYSPTENWQVTLVGGQSRDETENFKDGVSATEINTERDTISLQNDLVVADEHLITLGFDYQGDRIHSNKAYAVTSRDNKGLFTQYQGTFFAHDLQLSLRRDDNEQFGQYTAGGVAWGYAFGEDLRLTANYGTAFKAPTLNELYWPYSKNISGTTTYVSRGDPELSPEKSKTMELGLHYKLTAGTSLDLSVYETRARDLIDWTTISTGPNELTTLTTNTNKARIRGFETILATRIKGWDIGTNFTLLDPRNRSSGDNNGNLLPRRARRSLQLDVNRRFGKYTIGGTVLARSERYDKIENARVLDGYATVDLRAEYEFTKSWKLQTRIGNLLDKDYEAAAFYNQPGRSLFVKLLYQP
uniref:Vitamin B12 transporter n=1 Tax=Candidatus Kentrum sp. TUN TaxID=2126343 RepID=A0A450ZKL4_9GAMM|nr:MAG: vitamin B12 transporter [Candidatus Kentron sp. TUN]